MVLLRVVIFFIILLLLPDWYIYRNYTKIKGNKLLTWSLWGPTIILLFGLLGFAVLHDSLYRYFGIYLIVSLCFSFPKFVFMLFSLVLRGINRMCNSKLPHATLSAIPAIIILMHILYGAIIGKESFQVREVTFSSPNLPDSFDGYRIIQMSDIHTGSWNGDTEPLERAMNLCMKQNADLILFTGDLVNSRADEILDFKGVFSKLRAKDGVYSVLGNHDYGTYFNWKSEEERLTNLDSLISWENGMGWKMLNNEHIIINRGNDSIALIGVENSGKPPFPDYARLKDAMKGTEGMFQILMSHDPTHWRREVLPESDIELMLAGHTHDMQISLFGLTASSLIYPEHNGLYLEGKRGLYVNIGLGFVLFPMRLGAWPEITVITLRKE